MEQLTQEEILEKIEILNTEYERFTKTTLPNIIEMIVEEDYPISVAIGGLTATIDSMIKTYDLDDSVYDYFINTNTSLDELKISLNNIIEDIKKKYK